MINKTRCHGFTLIELMVVITVSAALLTVVTAWLFQVMSFSSSINRKQRHHQSLLRLESDFRDDIHVAKSIEEKKSDTSQILKLVMGDHSTVTYEIGPNRHVITKRVYEPGATEPRSFEPYRLSNKSESNWSFDDLPDWIALTVTRKQFADLPEASKEVQQNLQFVAMEEMPIDLHLKVRVNRWQLKKIDQADKQGGEQ